MQEALQGIVKIALSQNGVNKGEAIKKHIQGIIYSKEKIEIQISHSGCRENQSQPPFERPKMPPPIFGRSHHRPAKNFKINKKTEEAATVCSRKVAPLTERSQTLRSFDCSQDKQTQGETFNIILPNTIHGSKKWL
jgi:hypothetical protein